MTEQSKSSDGIQTEAIFSMTPRANDLHPVTYLKYLGDVFRQFRQTQPPPFNRAQNFCDHHIAPYLGETVSRNRLMRLESGDTNVKFGVVAAIISEMNAWPDVLNSLTHGQRPTLKYNHLVFSQLSPEIQEAARLARQKLDAKAANETKRSK